MKLYILLATLCFSSILRAQTTNSNLENVKNAVNNYFIGWEYKNRDLLKSIFHSGCKLKYLNREKQYQDIEIGKHIEEITAVDSKFLPPHVRNFITINIFGGGAYVQVHLRFRAFEVMDFFNLLKVDEEWKIVNKVSVSKVLPEEVIKEN